MLTNRFEIFVQVLLAHHFVFTDKVLAASHDDALKIVSLIEHCCCVKLWRLTELRKEMTSIFGLVQHLLDRYNKMTSFFVSTPKE